MNTLVEFYVDRPVVFIQTEQFSDISSLPEYQFRNLVVIGKNSRGREAYFDFGALCYKKKKDSTAKTHSCKVVYSSFVEFLEPVLNAYTKNKLSKVAATSTHSYISKLRKFVKYYYENLESLDFNNYEQCRKAYEKYTQSLIIKKSQLLASENKNGLASLAQQQHVFAELICFYHNLEVGNFKSSFIILKTTLDYNGINPVSIEDLSYFYEVNKRIFYTLKEFLMKGKKFPFVFDDNFINSKFYIYPKNSSWLALDSYFYADDGELLSKSEFKKRIKNVNQGFRNMGIEGFRKYLQACYNSIFNACNDTNPKTIAKARLINYAVSAFVMCFYCESSINPSQIYEMVMDDLSNYEDSIKGYKVVAIKPRAKYKEIELIIGVKMLPLIKAYKEFRNWCFDLVDNGGIDNIVFCLDTKLGSTNNPFEKVLPYSGTSTRNYMRIVNLYLPQVKWLPPTVIRKSVGNFILNETNSSVIAAQKLGNTPKVFNRSYAQATDKEFQEQVTDFFTNIHNQIARKYRKNGDLIDVNINLNAKQIPVGGCVENTPKLHSGFTDDLETPNCSNPSSCLFCENYVVHSDEEDIRKLMSLKKILSMSDKTDEAIIVTNRINEIFTILLDKHPETKNIFINVATSVNDGDFDEYWKDHLNLLLDLGVSFYD